MAAQNTVSFSNLFKIHYTDPIRDFLDNSTYFLSKIERQPLETGGSFALVPARYQRTTSIGARNDGASENLPPGDNPQHLNATFTVQSLYCTIRVTGKSKRLSQKAPNLAYAKSQVKIIEDTVKDYKKDINRQLFGDGSGELCQISAVSAAGGLVTVTCTSKLYPTNPTKFLHARQRIDIRIITTGALDANGDSLTINQVTGTSTFTYTGTAITTTSRAVYREDNVGTNAAGTATEIKEIFGLAAAVDSSNPSSIHSDNTRITPNYGNLDRTTYVAWQGQELHNSGVLRPFSVGLMLEAKDNSEIRSGGEISMFLTNHAIYRQYGLLLAGGKTFDGMEMDLDGGFKGLSVSGIPLTKDVECPDYHIFALDETTFQLLVTGPFEWLTDDSGNVVIRLPQQDQYEGAMVRDCQLMCDDPGKNVKIQDIAHS